MPETDETEPCATHPVRAYAKIVVVAGLLGIATGTIITLISRETVNDLRRHLSLWLIIGLVAVINIAAYLLFALFWAIYRWVKRDFEPDYGD